MAASITASAPCARIGQEQPLPPPRHRRFETLGRVARLDALGDVGLCRVMNMSNGGMMIETIIPLSCGDPVRISFDSTNALQGRVLWRVGTQAGIRFLAPIESLELIRKVARQDQIARPPRIPVNSAAWASSELGRFPTVVVNISQAGMRIGHSGNLSAGTKIRIALQCGLAACGTVRWSDGNLSGVELDRALPSEQLESARALGEPASRAC